MKLVSRDAKKRPRDEEDLLALARVADEAARAAEAVALIEVRGFARKRDLRAALIALRNVDLTED